jgi:hypothetical protein
MYITTFNLLGIELPMGINKWVIHIMVSGTKNQSIGKEEY